MKFLFIIALPLISFSAVAKDVVFLKNPSTISLLKKCQINFNPQYVETISISKKDHECLASSFRKKSTSGAYYFNDAPVEVKIDSTINVNGEDAKVYALAKKEFGLPQFLKKYPTYDGRGVVAGVIDDGISPHHTGFQKTTTGERKYIAHFSHSSAYTFDLTDNVEAVINLGGKEIKPDHIVIFDEKKFKGDYNDDGEKTELVFAIVNENNRVVVCHDLDLNQTYEKEDCHQSFSTSGEYGSWLEERVVPFMAEIDLKNKKFRISEGEWKGDSHGEGVASVMAGHKLFGEYDGVAPGAKIVDFDLSESSFINEEKVYTIGKFLNGISILAEAGANVINMSYSFYFHSARSQKAMSEALGKLIDHYNVLLVFSAGNNGPGLGSMNRSLIYPKNSLVAGAFISKEMDSLVHGATGVDEQGQIVYYSSRGPGGDFGMGPTVISPLASITHSDAQTSTRSFSGTSSAAPALAGISAVLMSAIQQEGLALNIDAVVAAIKMSGKLLENTPYIFQGFGLPQIEKALILYKKVISGAIPTDVIFGSTSLPNRDGVSAKGRLVRLQDAPSKEEFRIGFRGSFLVDREVFPDLQTLKIVDVEYSHSWLSGPERTWLSQSGGAFFSASADYSQIGPGSSETFGEIRVKDPHTKSLLAVFPVTVISKPNFDRVIKKSITLSPEKAKRVYFKTPTETNGLQLRLDLSELSGERVTYRLYNKDSVRVQSGSVYGGDELEVDHGLKPGEEYQLAFSRYRGNKEITFSMKLSPLKIKMPTRVAEVGDTLILQNKGMATVNGHLGLRSKLKPDFRGMVKSEDNFSYQFSYEIQEKGSFDVKLISPFSPDLTYFSYRCFQSFQEGELIRNEEMLLVEEDENIGKTVNVSCYIFDLAPGVEFNQAFEYQIFNESKREDTWSRQIKLPPRSTVEVPKRTFEVTPGQFDSTFETLDGAKVELGIIRVYEK